MRELDFKGVLRRVGLIYINGADSFFTKLDPDPWHVAHEDLESAMAYPDEAHRKMALVLFESKLTELLKIYKRLLELQNRQAPEPASIKDAFMRGFGDWFPPDVEPMATAPLPPADGPPVATNSAPFF